MDESPKEMTSAKLDVLVMPNGEILCNGNTIGYVQTYGKFLSQLKNAITGEDL